MPGPKTTPPDYAGLINQIASQVSGTLAIETPALGRVESHRPQDALAAIYMLCMLQNEAAGIPSTGVIVPIFNRGLDGPTNGGC